MRAALVAYAREHARLLARSEGRCAMVQPRGVIATFATRPDALAAAEAAAHGPDVSESSDVVEPMDTIPSLDPQSPILIVDIDTSLPPRRFSYIEPSKTR